MRNVKVTYIPENTEEEKELILYDVASVRSLVLQGGEQQLTILIDNSDERNKADTFSILYLSKILKIELLDEFNNTDIQFVEYDKLRKIETHYYSREKGILTEENIIKLIFISKK